MSFLHPFMLGLLALGGLIWLLHVRQRIVADVSSLLIWARVQQRRSSRQTTSWLPRLNWLMVLQMLVLLALVTALAEPIIGANRDVDHWIYILDNSGSMQAGPRQNALAQLAERLEIPDSSAKTSLIVAGIKAQPVFAAQPPGAENLIERLGSIAPEDGGADWQGAHRFATALSRPGQNTRIVILTDDAAYDASSGGDNVEAVRFINPAPNAALTAVLSDDPETDTMLVEGRVQFSGGLTQTLLTIELRGSDSDSIEVLARQTVTVAEQPDGIAEISHAFSRPSGGVISVRLGEDAAAFDNQAFFRVHSEPVTARILYLGPVDHPIARALDSISGVDLTFGDGSTQVGLFDLVVTTQQMPEGSVPTNLLMIAAAGPDQQWLETPIAQPRLQRPHSLGSSINWSSLLIDRALVLDPHENAQTIVSAGSQPLLDMVAREHGTQIRLAFDPVASNWPERSDFVIFVDQLVKMIVPAAGQTIDPVCQVGVPCAVTPGWAGGHLARIDSIEPHELVVGQSFTPHRAGLFEIVGNDRTQMLAIHPAPRSDLSTSGSEEPGTPNLPKHPVALWPWLVGVAGVLLLVEATLAQRRKDLSADWFRTNLWRAVALGLAVLAIANPHLPLLSTEQVIVVARPGLPTSDVANSEADSVYYRDTLEPDGTEPTLVGGLDDAVELALAMIPPEVPGSIVAQGRAAFDSQDAVGQALARSGRTIHAIATPVLEGNVWAGKITAPDHIFPGDKFSLQGVIGSTNAVRAEVTVTVDGEPIHAEAVDLAAGDNALSIPVTADDTGPMVIELTIAANADPEPIDNTLGMVLNIGRRGRVAILAGESVAGESLAGALADQGFSTEVIDPATAPTISAGWDSFDALMLMNFPAADLVTDQQRAIEASVRERGLGLMIMGGANSFGSGGYLETPLDEVSPISSLVPRDKPGVALVFVLDRSSSMSQAVGPVARLDVAKQATLAAARLLDEDSSVGVVTFDSSARLSLPLTDVSEMGFIDRSIGQISLGGGTALHRGLSAGYDLIRRADASARHIIVMTDGLSQPYSYDALLSSLIEDEITVSTVAIGQEAEHELLRWLAGESGGIFHASTDFEALPSILSQEAMRLSGEAFETAHVTPEWIAERPDFLSGIPETLPPIDGYVLATIKPEAETLATLDDSTGQPVPYLAHWQYGVGKVLALTTDAFGSWTTEWQGSTDYPRIFAQTLRAFQRPDGDDRLNVASLQDAIGMHLSLTDSSGLLSSMAASDSRTMLIPLSSPPAAGGRLEALVVPNTTGPQLLALGEELGSVGVYTNYPQRRNPSVTVDAARSLARQTGGAVLSSAADVPPVAPYWTTHAIWPFLVGAALVAFLLDLFNRYSGFARPWRLSGPKSH